MSSRARLDIAAQAGDVARAALGEVVCARGDLAVAGKSDRPELGPHAGGARGAGRAAVHPGLRVGQNVEADVAAALSDVRGALASLHEDRATRIIDHGRDNARAGRALLDVLRCVDGHVHFHVAVRVGRDAHLLVLVRARLAGEALVINELVARIAAILLRLQDSDKDALREVGLDISSGVASSGLGTLHHTYVHDEHPVPCGQVDCEDLGALLVSAHRRCVGDQNALVVAGERNASL